MEGVEIRAVGMGDSSSRADMEWVGVAAGEDGEDGEGGSEEMCWSISRRMADNLCSAIEAYVSAEQRSSRIRLVNSSRMEATLMSRGRMSRGDGVRPRAGARADTGIQVRPSTDHEHRSHHITSTAPSL